MLKSLGFSFFLVLAPSRLSRSSDITQGRKDERETPAFFHIREEATDGDHRKTSELVTFDIGWNFSERINRTPGTEQPFSV
jgi:hypothetical protein